MVRTPRRSFTTEFKEEAVRLVLQEGLSQSQVARDLDISVKSLSNWIAQAQSGNLKGSAALERLTPDQRRIRELERELKIAKMERDPAKAG